MNIKLLIWIFIIVLAIIFLSSIYLLTDPLEQQIVSGNTRDNVIKFGLGIPTVLLIMLWIFSLISYFSPAQWYKDKDKEKSEIYSLFKTLRWLLLLIFIGIIFITLLITFSSTIWILLFRIK